MELKRLCEEMCNLLEISDINQLGNALMACVRENDMEIYHKFCQVVGDLRIDWLQMIYQYYQADRSEKMQDYTPKSLAEFVGLLAGDSETIIDMCAGSGAITIQKWQQDPNRKFILYELDDNVIPYLLFNMCVRNINCTIYQADTLLMEAYSEYRITQGPEYGFFEEVPHDNIINIESTL